MPLNINTNITNNLNGYVADAKNVKGTYVVVENYSDLEDLPTSTLTNGSLAYVVNSDVAGDDLPVYAGLFMYNNGGWKKYLEDRTFATCVSANALSVSQRNEYSINFSYFREPFENKTLLSGAPIIIFINQNGNNFTLMTFELSNFYCSDLTHVFETLKINQVCIIDDTKYLATMSFDYGNNKAYIDFQELQAGSGGGEDSQEITIEQGIRVISLNSLYPAPVTILVTQDNLNAFFAAMSSVAGTTINEDNFATIWASLNTTARAQALGVLLTMYKHSVDYDGQPVLKFDSNDLSLYVAEVGSAVSGSIVNEYELNCIKVDTDGLTNATVTIAPLQTITISGGSGGTGSSRTLYHIEVADSNNHKAIIPIYKEAFDKYLVEMNQVGQQMATAMSITWTTLNTIDDVKDLFDTQKSTQLAYGCDLAMNLLVKYAYESGENPVLSYHNRVLEWSVNRIANYDLSVNGLGSILSLEYDSQDVSTIDDLYWFKPSASSNIAEITINSNATFTYTEEQISGGSSSTEPVSGGSGKLYAYDFRAKLYDYNGNEVLNSERQFRLGIYESNFERFKTQASQLGLTLNTPQDLVTLINNFDETTGTTDFNRMFLFLELIANADLKYFVYANTNISYVEQINWNFFSGSLFNSLDSQEFPIADMNEGTEYYRGINTMNSCTLTEYGTSGSGSGGETATKKWYKWVLSTSQDTTQARADSEYHNILNIKMSEDAWNTFKTDWATLLQQYNITQPSDFVTAFDQIKSSGDYTFRGYISQMYVAFGLICEYCIKDNSIPFTNIENDISGQNGFGIVNRVDGDSAYFRDSNGNTTTLNYSEAAKNFFIDQYSTLTITEETETISGSSGSGSTPSESTIPERFSIAQNLVVNMNGQQFDMIGVQAGGSIPGGMYPLTKWSDPQTNIEGYTYRTLQHREYDETNQQFTEYTTANEAKAKELVEFLTGNSNYDVYNATKPTPCFVFCTENNICWKLQYDGETNGLRAYRVNNFPLVLKKKYYEWTLHTATSNSAAGDNRLSFKISEDLFNALLEEVNQVMSRQDPNWQNITDKNGLIALFNQLKAGVSDPDVFALIVALFGVAGQAMITEKSQVLLWIQDTSNIDYGQYYTINHINSLGTTLILKVMGYSPSDTMWGVFTSDSTKQDELLYIDSNSSLSIAVSVEDI